MKISLFQYLFFLCLYTYKKYSPLRIFQIIETSKFNIDGNVLDLGSSNSSNNILKYNQTVKNIKYADKFSEKSEIIQIDLEKFPNNISENFHYVFLFNVMEHIKNFDNCLKNAFNLIKEDGKLIGSTPFLFRVHSSPHDYLRFTDQFLIEKFKEVGFSKYKVYVLIGGIFISFYSNIFTIVNKVPFSFIINIPLFFICLLLDKILSLFSKNLKNNYPIGYYFIAEK